MSTSNQPSNLSKTIFKAYDIRGIVDETLTESACYAIGRALAIRCNEQHITECVVGRDGRLSGERLSHAVSLGLMHGGVQVIHIGLCTTPLVYWATYHLNTGTGVMVTGSHNPPQYNGLKMMLGGDALYGDAIQRLYDLACTFMPEAENALKHNALKDNNNNNNNNSIIYKSLITEYHARIQSDTTIPTTQDKLIRAGLKPLKIVMDCGNGAAGAVAPNLFKSLNVEVIELFSEVDGTFPNHHPDPAHIENLQDLITALKHSDADVGVAFDGDGDRLGVVTREGEVIFPDRQLILFARDILSRNPNAPIVYDVKCSRLVGEAIAEHGGIPVLWKTGHSLIKAKMKALNAPFAGEMSGHLFFKERWYGFDDGVYALIRLLEILGDEKLKGHSATQVLSTLPNNPTTPEINIACAEGEAHELCAMLQTQGIFEGATHVHTLDGVRAEWADGFGLARASNTTPVIVLRFEAQTPEALKRIQAVFSIQLKVIKPSLNIPF